MSLAVARLLRYQATFVVDGNDKHDNGSWRGGCAEEPLPGTVTHTIVRELLFTYGK